MAVTLSSLVDALRQFKLLTPAQLQELETLPSSHADPETLTQELVQRTWLTPYQTNLLLQAKGEPLLLGSYVLLERLGEGGMGEVFKARNWKLGKIVALKLIHKDRVAHPNAVQRFRREVRAAAQLSHPHVVMAYDADEVAGTHLLVMEYVEGCDLAVLVKKQGPLTVPLACDFIRQAALGLQHSYEKGLVHRDVKPSNLLLAKDNVVKILDMGLARLELSSADADKTDTMTQEGAVVGTPDYIAPEQAMDSHTVDIRGDVYSLGCTFYFLLTGRAPFPGGTMMEKLFKHRLEEPQPVEQFRPDVPPAVAAVLRKMTAKLPEDRYQTPGEVATVLLALAGSPAQHPDERTLVEAGEQRAAPVKTADTVEARVASRQQRREAEQRRWLRLTMAGGAVLIGAVGLFVGLLVGQGSPRSETRTVDSRSAVATEPQEPPKKVDEAWLKQVAALPSAEKQVEAVAKKLKELNPDFDGKVERKIEKGVVTELEFSTDQVTDVSPVRALPGLRALRCGGTLGKGQLADLSPLKDLKLTSLNCSGTQVVNLAPLKGMPLTSLGCYRTPVADLSPLKGMRLTELNCGTTRVGDLSPLRGMPLVNLRCDGTPVADLAPLKEVKLTHLDCGSTGVSDLAPLHGMPLTSLRCWATLVTDLTPLAGMKLTDLCFTPKQITKGMEVLRQMPTLKTLSSDGAEKWTAAEFWQKRDAEQAAFAAWLEQVASMAAEQQVEAVAAKLKERNPDFDGKVKRAIENRVVTKLEFLTDNVTDLSPLRALPGLKFLNCSGSLGKGKLFDLTPLQGLHLTGLNCSHTLVADLTPLKDMKLTSLGCNHTKAADLSSLRGMPLTFLLCGGMPAADLTPLKGMPLKELVCDFRFSRDAGLLHSLKTLEKINGKPEGEFWKDVATQQIAFEAWLTQVAALPAAKQGEAVAAKLKELNPGFDGKWSAPLKIEKGVVTEIAFLTDNVTDVSPVQAFTGLRSLNFSGNSSKGRLADLSPLRGMPLTVLICSDTKVGDLSPLHGMLLTTLICHNTKVSDLSPLQGMPLAILTTGNTQVSDLSPLQGMPLTGLAFENTLVSELTPLEGMKLEGVLFTPRHITKGIEALRRMKTLKALGICLETKDYWLTAEFWKKYDAGEFK